MRSPMCTNRLRLFWGVLMRASPPADCLDQGVGWFIVIRVAGNVVAVSDWPVEFASGKFGTKLVVCLGHSHCGAVTACVGRHWSILISSFSQICVRLLTGFVPVFTTCMKFIPPMDKTLTRKSWLIEVLKPTCVCQSPSSNTALVFLKMRLIMVIIVGAVYDLDTSKVTFIE